MANFKIAMVLALACKIPETQQSALVSQYKLAPGHHQWDQKYIKYINNNDNYDSNKKCKNNQPSK